MLFALAPRGRWPTEDTCTFAGALVNVLGFGVWTLIYTGPRWDALVLEPARGGIQGAHQAVSKGRQQALTMALTSSCRTSSTPPATTRNSSVAT